MSTPRSRSPRATNARALESAATPPAPSNHLLLILAIALPVLLLLPFVNKAFHADDTMFLWVARQIQIHPLDFFGFVQNWYGYAQPISEVNKNPPGVSFYLAAVMALTGENEIPVHLAFLPIAAAISAGAFLLGRKLGLRPALAAIAAAACVLTPAFLVSCTNVMSDPLMVAWYVWAIVLWIHGLDTGRFSFLALSGVCMALSALSKYFGLTVVPLLLVYSIFRQRRFEATWLALLVPIVAIGVYQAWTSHLYGTGLFLDAASYARQGRTLGGLSPLASALVGLSFTGGCLGVLLFAPFLWSWRGLALGAVVAALAAWLIGTTDFPAAYPLRAAGSIRAGFLAQWVLLIVGGVSVLALALHDAWKRRDAASMLLLCWVGGTFLFSTVANWTINGRSVFPMAPAVGLLLARRVETLLPKKSASLPWRYLVPLLPAAILALCATWADYRGANSVRDTARQLGVMQREHPGTLWFAGHWGFQYYMERAGMKAIDYRKPRMVPGDWAVIPDNNSSVYAIPEQYSTRVTTLKPIPCAWMSTMSLPAGAGFYSQLWGPLPYVFGRIPADQYDVLRLKAP